MPLVARYREFAPCEALREYVRAFFTFAVPPEHDPSRRPVAREREFRDGEPFWLNMFADAHSSMVFSYGPGYRVEGLWNSDQRAGHVIGAMSSVRAASHGQSLIQVGAFFRASHASRFTHVPASELTDRIVSVEDVWGAAGSELEIAIGEARGDEQRVALLETALLDRLARWRSSGNALDLAGLAAWIRRRHGRVTVTALAGRSGISRQHLTRAFREGVGVTPKLYCRLARFQAGLARVGAASPSDWARAAVDMGYTDQSHLIAEFKEFSGITPVKLTSDGRFHPFLKSD